MLLSFMGGPIHTLTFLLRLVTRDAQSRRLAHAWMLGRITLYGLRGRVLQYIQASRPHTKPIVHPMTPESEYNI
jgi:hypothetical protein